MQLESVERTLLEDWQARRERLGAEAGPRGQFAEVQIRILDYLIDRYRDSAEAARPAGFSPKSRLYVNERAIVVHHHVWQGKVGGVKSPREARDRMSAILARMSSAGADRSAGTAAPPPAGSASPRVSPDLLPDAFCDPYLWSSVLRRIHEGRNVHRDIQKALRRNPVPPDAVVRHLCECLACAGEEDPRAASLLASCSGAGAFRSAVFVWAERLKTSRADQGARRLGDFFCREDVCARAVEHIRAELANSHPAVRLEAIEILGCIGTLDDVGLLADLLSLPPAEDEHPEERDALVWAMREISEMTRENTSRDPAPGEP